MRTKTTFNYAGFTATIHEVYSRATESARWFVYLRSDQLGEGQLEAGSYDAITEAFADWVDESMADEAAALMDQHPIVSDEDLEVMGGWLADIDY